MAIGLEGVAAAVRWFRERGGRARYWPVIALGAIVTLALVLLSPDYGVTVDEPIRNTFGNHVLDYLTGRPTDFVERGVLKLYGGLYDVTAVAVHRTIGGDLWVVRHAVNAAFGGVGILAIGLFATRLFGTPMGLLTIVLLALSPRFVGHAMNNPKDAPFAAMCSVALLAFTLIRPAPPFVTWPRAILIGLALALPLNIRPGALLYWGYLGLLVGWLYLRAGQYTVRGTADIALRLAAVTLVMLLAGCIFWPWAQGNPIVRPFQALLGVADFPWPYRVLFLGRRIPATELPPSYLPVWMLVTIPPVVLAGVVASLAAALVAARQRLLVAGLWTVVLFPIVMAIVLQSTLYNGWRHVLFVYPPLVVLAALGWQFAWTRARTRVVRAAVAALLAVGCAEPLWFAIRNHPFEGIYFNALVGGPRRAASLFELDYWGNGLLPAVAWSAALAEESGVRLRITAQRAAEGPVRLNAARFPSLIGQAPRHGTHHLEVRGMRRALEMPPHTLHVVSMADGAHLAVVVAGPRFSEVRDRLVRR